MSRTQAVLPGGPRLSDYLSIGVIAQVYPITWRRATGTGADLLWRVKR